MERLYRTKLTASSAFAAFLAVMPQMPHPSASIIRREINHSTRMESCVEKCLAILQDFFACAYDEGPGGHSDSAAQRSKDRSWEARVVSSGPRDTRPDLIPERRREEIPAIDALSVHRRSPRPTGCDESVSRPKLPTACNRDDAADAGGTARPGDCESSPGTTGSKSSTT